METPEVPPSDFVGCTSSTVSHLARARVVAESWRRHHPDSPFAVLLTDGEDRPPETEAFDVVLPEELGLPASELAVQRGIYDAYELTCALKPRLLQLLLERGASAVVFSDTDTCFYAPVDDVAATAAVSSLVLTPSTARPVGPRRYLPVGPLEHRHLLSGLFNTGLVAVGPGGGAFLDWWSGRLARDCLVERPAGMWTDQMWVDWVPVYFDHVISRDPSLNVGIWNLDERELLDVEGKPSVDGAPLRHFHFWGFDPRRPDEYSAYYDGIGAYYRQVSGRDMPGPPPNPALTRLLQDYAKRLLEHGSEELLERSYRYGVGASGRPLGLRERAVYREAVLAAEACGADPPPSPFDPSESDEFERLVDDPSTLGSLSPQAQRRLEHVRPAGISRSSFARASRRLRPALRYALTGRFTPGAPALRVESEAVRLEYSTGSRPTD
jgi:hypothetical protein